MCLKVLFVRSILLTPPAAHNHQHCKQNWWLHEQGGLANAELNSLVYIQSSDKVLELDEWGNAPPPPQHASPPHLTANINTSRKPVEFNKTNACLVPGRHLPKLNSIDSHKQI